MISTYHKVTGARWRDDVLRVLRERGEPLAPAEIVSELGVGPRQANIVAALRILVEQGFVEMTMLEEDGCSIPLFAATDLDYRAGDWWQRDGETRVIRWFESDGRRRSVVYGLPQCDGEQVVCVDAWYEAADIADLIDVEATPTDDATH